MKKRILSISMLAWTLILLSSCGRPFTKEESKPIFLENKYLFNRAVDICETHNIKFPVLEWKLYEKSPKDDENEKISSLSDEEKEVFKQLGDLGIENINYQNIDSEGYHLVQFTIQHTNEQNSQGIIVLLPDSPVDLESYLRRYLSYHSDFECDKLEERTYYYLCRGDSRVSNVSSSGMIDSKLTGLIKTMLQ